MLVQVSLIIMLKTRLVGEQAFPEIQFKHSTLSRREAIVCPGQDQHSITNSLIPNQVSEVKVMRQRDELIQTEYLKIGSTGFRPIDFLKYSGDWIKHWFVGIRIM